MKYVTQQEFKQTTKQVTGTEEIHLDINVDCVAFLMADYNSSTEK